VYGPVRASRGGTDDANARAKHQQGVGCVAGGFSALRIPEWLLKARATVLGKEISRGLKLGMKETNYAG